MIVHWRYSASSSIIYAKNWAHVEWNTKRGLMSIEINIYVCGPVVCAPVAGTLNSRSYEDGLKRMEKLSP